MQCHVWGMRLLLDTPRIAPAAYSRSWLSILRSPSLSPLRAPGLGAGISTTCLVQKRPRRAHVQVHASADPEFDTSKAAFGKVMAAQANFVRVKVESVEGDSSVPPPRERLLCVVRGLLKKIKQSVLVGDTVKVVGIDWTDGRGMVEEVLPRTSELSDPAVANVDHVVLVFSAAAPPWQPVQVTRYLVAAEAAGLPLTLVLNKADLTPEEEVAAIVSQAASWGYQAIAVSVVTGQGLEELAQRLAARVSVVAGPSGAGKSSIINALRLRSAGREGSLFEAMGVEPTRSGAGSSGAQYDEEGESGSCSSGEEEGCEGGDAACNGGSSSRGPERGGSQGASSSAAVDATQGGQQEAEAWLEPSRDGAGGNGAAAVPAALEELELQAVGDVSQRIGRGKHTTRNVTLLELGAGALLADTPGFNQPVLGMPAAELGEAFPEVRQRLQEGRCAFANCQHLAEPGCMVRGDWERYSYYTELHAELAAQEDVERERAASKKRREGTVRYKSRAGGVQGAEARLESKSHRRVSRRSVKQQLSQISKGMDDEDY